MRILRTIVMRVLRTGGRQVDFEDRHVEVVGDLALVLVAVDDADEFGAEHDLDRVLARSSQLANQNEWLLRK